MASPPLPPTTTAEQDRKSASGRPPSETEMAEALKAAGQREISLIWEMTQMKVALSVVWASLIVATSLGIFGRWLGAADIQLAAIVFLFGVANLVTGFYFGRTNHQKVGGPGGETAGTR